MKGAEILVNLLLEQDVDTVFGYPGGQVVDIYNALNKYKNKIKHIITAHEQGAAHSADGYARVSGKTGVVIATSGPGATNLVTGIANAYLDSVPVVFITGNVATDIIGRDGFQEVDIAGITMPIVKHNYIVHKIEDLSDIIRSAFKIAHSGRFGPVLVDIPKDIQIAEAEYKFNKQIFIEKKELSSENCLLLLKAVKLLQKAKRPLIYCGGGVVSSKSGKYVEKISKKLSAPIVTSMMGLSAINGDNELLLGMAGLFGENNALEEMKKADVILALGTRFSDRTFVHSLEKSKQKIIHIDIDSAEINKNIVSYLGICAELLPSTVFINSELESMNNKPWAIKKEKSMNDTFYDAVKIVNKYTNDETVIVTDVGNHQVITANAYNFKKSGSFVTSGGLGTMGFGLGASIGAYMANKQKTVLFTGDGSFGMNLNELATAVSEKCDILIVISNNNKLGMVYDMQTDGDYCTVLNRKTDFSAVARGFGANAFEVNNLSDFEKEVKKAFSNKGVYVIDFKL